MFRATKIAYSRLNSVKPCLTQITPSIRCTRYRMILRNLSTSKSRPLELPNLPECYDHFGHASLLLTLSSCTSRFAIQQFNR